MSHRERLDPRLVKAWKDGRVPWLDINAVSLVRCSKSEAWCSKPQKVTDANALGQITWIPKYMDLPPISIVCLRFVLRALWLRSVSYEGSYFDGSMLWFTMSTPGTRMMDFVVSSLVAFVAIQLIRFPPMFW